MQFPKNTLQLNNFNPKYLEENFFLSNYALN